MIKVFRALELKIRLQGRIQKNIVNAYLNRDGIPMLWKMLYSNIAHDSFYKHNQHCRESYFHDFTKTNGCFFD